jgi:hypothetical protein
MAVSFADYMKHVNAMEYFGKKYPKFYQHFSKCCDTGALFEAYVHPPEFYGWACIGLKGKASYDTVQGAYVLDIQDAWSSLLATPDYEIHYVPPYNPSVLWDNNGEPSSDLGLSTQANPSKTFPYLGFFSLGEKHGYCFTQHPGVKGCGEEIYAAIKTYVKSTTKRDCRRPTEKQLLTKISEIIADITGNVKVKDSFQDDTDPGFSSDEDERYEDVWEPIGGDPRDDRRDALDWY